MPPRFLLLLAAFLFSHALPAQWSYLGLSHAAITSNLTISGDTIYASTHDGIYKKHVLSTDTLWIPCGMQGAHVVQTVVKDPLHFTCVTEIGSSYTTQIYGSSDGGATFNLLNPDTSNGNAYMFLNAIAHPPGNFDTLYFLNHQLKTYNGGITWDTLANYLLSDRFIRVHPQQHNKILIGGETFILSAYVQTSDDYGSIWSIPAMAGYFAGDNSIHDLVIDGADTWTAVGEGVICRTSDGGDNWTQLLNVWSWPLPWQLYMWDIELSPADSNKLYVTGDNTVLDRVPLYYSQDYGLTWDTLSSAAAVPVPSIKCLAVKNTSSGDKVFLGGNGIYAYLNISTGLHETSKPAVTIFPNPFRNNLYISLPAPGNAEVILYDMMYRKVLEEKLLNTVTIDTQGLSKGAYLVEIKTSSAILQQLLVKH